MGCVEFVNPNCPEQPAGGVYRWYCVCNGRKSFTLYVGAAGGPRQTKSGRPQKWPSTLYRGISHASSADVTTNNGKSLDTDFIVGSAIRYFKSKGYDCYWEHVCDDPTSESKICDSYQPILQDGKGKRRNIKREFRPPKPDESQWSNADVDLATAEFNKLFDKLLKDSATCMGA